VKIQTRSSTKTEPETIISRSIQYQISTRLRGNIGQGTFSHRLHAVEVCVAGARSFWLLVYGAWGRKDMFETLARDIVSRKNFIAESELTKTSISLFSKPFHGSSGS
jgi:hypothetical protein